MTNNCRHATAATLIVLLGATVWLPGCGDSAEQAAVKATIRTYDKAVLNRDGWRACALLTSRCQHALINALRTLRPELPNNCVALIANLPLRVSTIEGLLHVKYSVSVHGNTARATPTNQAGRAA